jgi:hypothetical protein
MPTAEKDWRVVRIMSCATERWSVPGGTSYALGIAWRESHYDPFAWNDSGCGGVMQHMLRYWPARVRAYLEPSWFRSWPNVSIFNARANIIVAVRMAHDSGWDAWGG